LKNVLRAVFIKQNCTKSDRMSAFRNAEPSSSNSVDSVEDFVNLSRVRFNPQSNKKR
jgi:hypothetical protein